MNEETLWFLKEDKNTKEVLDFMLEDIQNDYKNISIMLGYFGDSEPRNMMLHSLLTSAKQKLDRINIEKLKEVEEYKDVVVSLMMISTSVNMSLLDLEAIKYKAEKNVAVEINKLWESFGTLKERLSQETISGDFDQAMSIIHQLNAILLVHEKEIEELDEFQKASINKKVDTMLEFFSASV